MARHQGLWLASESPLFIKAAYATLAPPRSICDFVLVKRVNIVPVGQRVRVWRNHPAVARVTAAQYRLNSA